MFLRIACNLSITIKSDYGTVDHIKIPDAVFVPSYPFNLLPPHIFIPDLQNAGHETNYSKHDDVKYIFNYKLPSKGKNIWINLTIPIVKNKSFTMSTSNGYTFFFQIDSTYDYEWVNFAGAYHKISEDDDKKPPSDQPP